MRMQLAEDWNTLCKVVKAADVQLARPDLPTPSRLMCRYLIAGEDHRFRYHPGVDPIAICRAIGATLLVGSRQGGSTIAMQLVRTVTGRYENTFGRKLREAVLALLLTMRFGKQRLPDLYLWVAYYGWGMNNFLQACTRLRISPNQLGEMEAAKFVARLKYPEPRESTLRRQLQILTRGRHLIARAQKTQSSRVRNWIQKYGAI